MSTSFGWRAWVEFWNHRESPASLSATRILVGLALVGDLSHAELLGARRAAWSPPPEGMGIGANAEHPLAARWFGATSATADALFWIALVAALCFSLGALFRVSALVLLLALGQLAHFAPSGDRGIDQLLRIVVAVLALSGAHRRLSVDAWIGARLARPPPREVPAWPRYLLFAQLVWMYFSAAHNRADAAWWPHGDFSAVAQILADPHIARFRPVSAAWAYPLLQAATATTMLFELGAPLLIPLTFFARRPGRGGRLGDWLRRYRVRWLWLGLGVSLHVGIAITLRLGVFPFGVLALYPLLLHPDEIEHLFARWSRQTNRA